MEVNISIQYVWLLGGLIGFLLGGGASAFFAKRAAVRDHENKDISASVVGVIVSILFGGTGFAVLASFLYHIGSKVQLGY